MLRFVNQVAAIIAPSYPQVTLSTLAYLETFRPYALPDHGWFENAFSVARGERTGASPAA